MAFKDKSYLNKPAKGVVTYNKDIVLSVINLAAKEIAGVSSLVANFGSVLTRWFSKNYYEGVKTSYVNGNMNVDIYMNVYYGYNVSEIAYRVQENIKNSLASMVEMKIDKINVHVLGVDFPTEEEIV
jgi:uncharacterized alkaline shock family protein YloU